MPSLFISYRRTDSPDTVKLIHERLKRRLPRWEIFYDHESIPLGEQFPERLRAELDSAAVVLVIIGPKWLDILQERKNAAVDHVRVEVRLALEASTNVVPILVGRAALPTDADLADFADLQPLLKRNGRSVRPDPDFDGDLEPLIAHLKQFDSDEAIGATLADKYTLTVEIAHGGMGVVYRAEQKQPVKRTVAVKLIKPGMDSRDVLARFDAERQALAVMDHPNIAKVHDAGMTAQGRPFFVMEFVKGVPITQYCDDKKLTPQERLNLFIPVCNAVQHAHQKGIIHRDLKPSNVLVEIVDGKPVPKVIDFGLAKALGQKLTDKTLYSALDTRIGTLEYSAPEQAAGRSSDVDTRSDIYSLGILLYELLTGAPPFTRAELLKIGEEEMRRVIREDEPTKPSKKLSSSGELPAIAANRHLEPKKLTRLVQGDLDWIVMKCLEKENARCSETANELGKELQRFLADEPVHAGPPSASYRMKKFLRRNKGPAIAAALVFLVLVAGVIGTSIGLVQAELAREAEAQQGELTAAALVKSEDHRKLAEKARVEAEQSELKFKKERDAARVAEEKERQAKAKETTAKLKEQQARFAVVKQEKETAFQRDKALKYFAKAQDAVDKMLTLVCENKDLLLYEPRMEEIRRRLLEEALGYYRGFLQEKSDNPGLRKETARGFGRLGNVFVELGRLTEADHSIREALKLRKQLADDFPQSPDYLSDLAYSHHNLGVPLEQMGRTQEAEEAYQKALKFRQQLVKDFPQIPEYRSYLAHSHNNLGVLLQKQGRSEEAEAAFRKALNLQKQLVDDGSKSPEHRSGLANSYNNLGVLLEKTGRAKEAAAAHREALKLWKQLADDGSKNPAYPRGLALSYNNLGVLLEKTAEAKEAEEAFKEALRIQKQLVEDFPKSPDFRSILADNHNNLGVLLEKAGCAQEAVAAHQEALKLRQQLANAFPKNLEYRSRLTLSHTNLAVSLNNLGMMLLKGGHVKKAEEAFQEAVKLLKQLADNFPTMPEFRDRLAVSHTNLGELLYGSRRFKDAREAHQEAVKLLKQLADKFSKMPDYRSRLAVSHSHLGFILLKTGHDEKAVLAYREVVKIQQQLADDFPEILEYHNNLAVSHSHLGFILEKLDRLQDAEESYRAALKIRKQLVEESSQNVSHRDNLAANHHLLAMLLQKMNRLPKAEKHYHAGISLRRQLVKEFPKDALLQANLAAYLNNLGVLNRDLPNLAEAKKLMEQSLSHNQVALELDPINAVIRSNLAGNHTHLADILVRLKTHAAAVKAAAEVLRIAPNGWQEYHRGALFTCQAIPLAAKDTKLTEVQRQEAIEGYSVQAVQLLQQAVQHGYTDAAALKQEPAFAPLRDRPDFQKLLSKLDGKMP